MMKNYFITVLMFLTFNLNSFSQSAVINEVITDPQTDWSTNGFDGTDGNGTVSNVDESIELYIKTDGLDLTGWTLELLDGTDVTGDLTSTGAFDVSNYISSTGGTFTSTKIGDYLVLGNVDGSGAINNSITINLKNNSGTLIDSVTLGGGIGEAPSGNASSVNDESIQRIPNGTDTNNNSTDFSKYTASLGSTNPTSVLSTESITKFNIEVYPNPATQGKLFIKSNNSEIKKAELFNVLGRKVLTKTITFNQEINVSNLNPGLYVLRIKKGNKSLTKKIVIK